VALPHDRFLGLGASLSRSERDNAIAQFGYQSEGIAGYIFDSPTGNASALYRLVNPTTSDHFYTMSAQERDNAIAQFGYQSEGIAGYVIDSQTVTDTSLYRLLQIAV